MSSDGEVKASSRKPTIFLSYAWRDQTAANEIEDGLKPVMHKIIVLRDIRDLHYRGHIPSFMQRIREADYALLLISPNYLRSPNCMAEFGNLLRESDFQSKVLPVVMKGAGVFSREVDLRLEHYDHWHQELCKLQEKRRQYALAGRNEPDELQRHIKIFRGMHEILDQAFSYLQEHLVTSPKELKELGYKPLLDAVGVDSDDSLKEITRIYNVEDGQEQRIEIERFKLSHGDNAALAMEGHIAFFRGELKLAAYFFGRYLQENPEDAQVHHDLGLAYRFQHDYIRAIESYSTAIALAPADPRAYNDRAFAHILVKKFEAAVEDYDKSLSLDYESWIGNDVARATPYNNRGGAKLELGKHAEALIDLTKALELNPNYADAYSHRVEVHKMLGQYEEALKDYDSLIELSESNSGGIHSDRGIIHRKLGNLQAALEDYDTAISLGFDEATVYNNRGVANCELRNFGQARNDYGKALQRDPEYIDAYYNRAALFSELKEHKKAIRDYSAVIRKNPPGNVAHNARHMRAQMLIEWGKFSQAIKAYAEILVMVPGDPVAHNNRGYAYRRLGKHGSADRDFRQARESSVNVDSVLGIEDQDSRAGSIAINEAIAFVSRPPDLRTIDKQGSQPDE